MRKMSAEEVAEMLGVTLRTLRNWEQQGQGPKKVMEDRKPVYPVKNLKAWLRRNRPDIQIGKAPAPDPAERAEAREEKATATAWDDFFNDCEADKRKDKAYTEACAMDDRGEHAAADTILLKAGIPVETVKERRAHLDYNERLKKTATATAIPPR